MKYIAFFAAIVLAAPAALADPITVEAPAGPRSEEAARAYVVKLDAAVKEVCYAEAGPVVGIGYYSYLNCVKDTRAAVAKQDPTGLYAKRESTGDLVVAARKPRPGARYQTPGGRVRRAFFVCCAPPGVLHAQKMSHLPH